ncbi:TPA: SOS response-associated peptidase [Legionella pneumophila]
MNKRYYRLGIKAMCGRFGLDAPTNKIKAQFNVNELTDMVPRYNIAPSQDILFLCRSNGEQGNHALFLRWGLIPYWSKDKKIGNSLINARCETVSEKPAFRQSFKSRRGIVVMSGFFEWQQGVIKQPYYFKSPNNNLLAVAALWDSWQSPDGTEVVHSCTLITTSADQLMSPIHHRMPVLLDTEARDLWMDNSHCDTQMLLSLLKPYTGIDLMYYPVSPKMNNARFVSSEAIEPIQN